MAQTEGVEIVFSLLAGLDYVVLEYAAVVTTQRVRK